MKKITAFFAAVAAATFLTLGILPSVDVFALSSSAEIIPVVNDSSSISSENAEFSIPQNIGTQIPKSEKAMPIIGFIMWALVAVAIMTALIVMFANLGGTNVSHDSSVRRKRYRKKQPQKSKLLKDKYYRK